MKKAPKLNLGAFAIFYVILLSRKESDQYKSGACMSAYCASDLDYLYFMRSRVNKVWVIVHVFKELCLVTA